MISDLPGEVIEQIAMYLDHASLSSLRLVSKQIETKTFQYWVKDLNTLRTDLGIESLQKLLAIGDADSLSQNVHKLTLLGDSWGHFGNDLTWPRDQDGSLLLSESNEDFKLFTSCLSKNLQKCRSFDIRGPTDSPPRTERLTTSDVVMLVLNMVAETELEINSFTVDFHDAYRRPRIAGIGSGWVDASRIQNYSLVLKQASFNRGWSHLRELHLHSDIRPENVDWAHDLIQKAPALRKLSLSFHVDICGMIEKIVAIRLPALEDLYFSRAYISATTLLKFLDTSRATLRRLRMNGIHLEHDSGPDDNGRLRDWKYFFHTLQTKFQKLESVSFFLLRDEMWGLPEADSERPKTMLFQKFLEDDGARFLNDDPQQEEKIDLTIKSKTPRRDDGQRVRVAIVFGVHYQGAYMAKALQRLEEAVDHSPYRYY